MSKMCYFETKYVLGKMCYLKKMCFRQNVQNEMYKARCAIGPVECLINYA